MLNRTKEMGEWRIFETADAVAEHVAEWLCALACECDRDFAVCLSGGSTPRHLYRQLTRKPIAARFPWKTRTLVLGRRTFCAAGQPGQ